MRPMGLWSILMILSRYSTPSMPSHLPGRSFAWLSLPASVLYSTSLTSEDLPLPDTPVTHVMTPSGICTSTCLRLCSLAPRITSAWPFPVRHCAGTGIFFLPDRYCPVMERSQRATSSGVPAQTTSPPCTPAPGPISMR